jgi:hypothetical protein
MTPRREVLPMLAAMSRGLLSHILLAMCAAACGQETPPDEEAPLPKLAEMKLPDAETLLRGKPVDWVVLRNEDTLVVEPVSPRPQTLEKLDAELKRLANVRPRNKEEADELRQKRIELTKLQVSLIDGDEDPDYTIETRLIKEIRYHEDHVLERASRCIDEGLTSLAFELLVYLDRRHPNWPGYHRQVSRLLLKEAEIRLQGNDPESALRFAEELHAKDKAFPGLSVVLGDAVDRLVQAAVEGDDYRRARHFLGRLAARDAEHPVFQRWRTELIARTNAGIEQARAAAAAGDASRSVALIDQSARIWPDTPGLREAHRELAGRYQVLRVGVLELPTDPAPYPFSTRASDRADRLTTLLWFETSRYDENGPRYRSVPCESWDPDDLGREIRFTLRRDRAEWESRPRFTSATLAAELKARLDPGSDQYDDRLASYVAGIATPSPFELMVRFRRPPLRPEAFFRFSLVPADDDAHLNADLPSYSPGSGERFRLVEADESRCRFLRLRPEPDSARQRHIAEVVEHRYDNWDRLLQGLQRGEVSAVPHVAHIDLAGLKDDPRFFVLPYAQPVSHVVQFQPRSSPLQNGPLRRALLHAIPRGTILTEQFLAGVPQEPVVGRLTSSPFTVGSAAHNRLLPPLEYDPILAAGLAATARKTLGGTLPPLKITFPPQAEVRRAVDAMIAHWKRVGIDVSPVASSDEPWDLAYRTVQFREPLVDLWPFLTVDPTASMASLTPFPERIRRQVLELERATDWNAAIRVLHRLQIDLVVDAWWIPLWEVDEFCLVRRNISGLPEKLVHPYQDVERWVVQPWYPTEAP